MDYGPAYEEYEGMEIGLYGGKFFPPHIGHYYTALEAASKVDVLFVAVHYDDVHEASLVSDNGFEPVGYRLRVRWLTELFKDRPNIRVISLYEPRVDDYLTNPKLPILYTELQKKIGTIHKIFSGEPEYTPYFKNVLPNAQHVIIEKIPNVSATQVRNGEWDLLIDPVKRYFQKRVAFVGGESSGKTYTAELMAQQLGYRTLPEYGRRYYDELGGYGNIEQKSDFVNIAAGHLMQLHEERDVGRLLLVDTDLIYTQFYHLEAHGYLNLVLDALIREQTERIDKWLFFMPYEFDDDGTRTRRTEAEREEYVSKLMALYEHYGVELTVIYGDSQQRLSRVTKELQDLATTVMKKKELVN